MIYRVGLQAENETHFYIIVESNGAFEAMETAKKEYPDRRIISLYEEDNVASIIR